MNIEVSPNICSRNIFLTIFFVDMNINTSLVFCKAIVYIAKFREKLFSFDNNVLNFMLNCWDMAPDVPHI